jgi:hypothetical protein
LVTAFVGCFAGVPGSFLCVTTQRLGAGRCNHCTAQLSAGFNTNWQLIVQLAATDSWRRAVHEVEAGVLQKGAFYRFYISHGQGPARPQFGMGLANNL